MFKKINFYPFPISFILLILSMIIMTLYGFDGKLMNLASNYIYAGTQMMHGVPPYQSIFNQTGPVTPLLSGIIIYIGNLLGMDSIIFSRICYSLISSIGFVIFFWLIFDLFHSKYLALISFFILLNFHHFIQRSSCLGPEKKVLLVFLIISCFYLLNVKKHFLLGISTSLAILTWQPAGILPIAYFVSIFISKDKNQKQTLIIYLLGILFCTFFISLYFYLTHSFKDMLDGTLFFNLFYNQRPSKGWLYPIQQFVNIFHQSFPFSFFLIFVGFIILFFMPIIGNFKNISLNQFFTNPIFCFIYTTFLLFLIFSFHDFQGIPDAFIFIPYLVFILIFCLSIAHQWIMRPNLNLKFFNILICLICSLLYLNSLRNAYSTSISNSIYGIQYQRKGLSLLKNQFSPSLKFLSIGTSQILVLLNATNPNRFVFLATGIDTFIDNNEPGGFDAWIEGVKTYNPDVIGVKNTYGKHIPKLMQWIQTNYHIEAFGPFKLYIKNS